MQPAEGPCLLYPSSAHAYINSSITIEKKLKTKNHIIKK